MPRPRSNIKKLAELKDHDSFAVNSYWLSRAILETLLDLRDTANEILEVMKGKV